MKGEMTAGQLRKHKNKRLMLLKNGDHALVFRKQKDGTIVVELNIGVNKKTGVYTDGGIVLSTIATNIFSQEFMDMINNQIAVAGKAGPMKEGTK